MTKRNFVSSVGNYNHTVSIQCISVSQRFFDDGVNFSVKKDENRPMKNSQVITGGEDTTGTYMSNVFIEAKDDVTIQQVERKKKTNYWRWMCVFGSFFIHAIIQGCFGKSSGILQLWFEEEFNSSTVNTTLVFSIANALQMLLGPLTSTVCNLTSCRTSVIVGGIIVTVGVLLTGFSSNIWLVFITYGIIGGVGRAFSYCPAITIIGLYFKDKSGFPVGLASSGSGFGTLIFPFIVEWAFKTYGFTGALIILGGIVLNICVLGSLFTPIRRKRKLVQLSGSQEMQPENKNKYNRFTSVVFNKRFTTKTSVKEKKKMFNLKILKNSTFTLFCCGLGICCGNRVFHFLPSMVRQKGINDLQTTSLLSISGVFETISRILSGIVFDTNCFKTRRMIIYNGLMYLLGIVTLTLPYLNDYITYAVICAVSGAVMGAIASQKTVIIIDILGPEHICDANGILTFFRGIGVLVGPPIAGLLRDVYGGYTETNFLNGSFAIIGSLFITIGMILQFIRNRKSKYLVKKEEKCSFQRF